MDARGRGAARSRARRGYPAVGEPTASDTGHRGDAAAPENAGRTMTASDPLSRAPLRTTGDCSLFVLGDEGVFFAAPRQELYVFNTSATFVWCCIEAGMTPSEIVERYAEWAGVDRDRAHGDVAGVLAQWWRAGYIESPGIAPGAP